VRRRPDKAELTGQSFPDVNSGETTWLKPLGYLDCTGQALTNRQRFRSRKEWRKEEQKICSSHMHDDKHPGKSKQEKKDCENDSQEGPAIMGPFSNDKASPQKKNDGKY
jgi:hypothetical protein